jgi:hypothetical protein
MNGASSREPARKPAPGDAAANTDGASARKEDSGISVSSANTSLTGKDSGYGTQTDPDVGPSTEVDMEDAPPIVPSSLRPGSETNRVVETSKGLWSGVGSRR